MRNKNIIRFALKTVVSNRNKFFLSALGIIIGIIAQIVSMSLSLSYTKNMESFLIKSGASAIELSIKSNDDAEAVENLISNNNLIDDAIQYYDKELLILVNEKKIKVNVIFTKNNYFQANYINSITGAPYIQNINSQENNVIINERLAKEFVKGSFANLKIDIGQIPFSVSAIVDDGRLNQKYVCYISNDLLSKFNIKPTDNMWLLLCNTVDFEALIEIKNDIDKYLSSRYHSRLDLLYSKNIDESGIEAIKCNVFNINSITSDLEDYTLNLELIQIIMTTVFVLLMIVGGLGIGNIFSILYSERYSEIGLAKSVGATRKSILFQFIVETMLIAFSAAIIGAILGILFAYVFGLLINMIVVYSWNWIIISLIIALLLPIFLGLFHAIKCSRLDPIKAINL